MSTAFVIGNGLSRKNIDLTKLPPTTWGCNALYRDFTPDFLVASDKAMQAEIKESKYYIDNVCYFQDIKPRLEHPNIRYWKQHKKSANNSGVAAIYHALKANNTTIYLLGFDIINPQKAAHWNIYNQTRNYKRATPKVRRETPATIGRWASLNKHIRFIRVIDLETCWYPDHPLTINSGKVPYPMLNSIKGLRCLEHISIEEFNDNTISNRY